VRQAFEVGVRGASQAKRIKHPYRQDGKHPKADALLTGLKGWACNNVKIKAEWECVLAQLEMFNKVVMNPYSHPSAPNIPRQEVADAANAVDNLLDLVRRSGKDAN
jgi:hypothetical protein